MPLSEFRLFPTAPRRQQAIIETHIRKHTAAGVNVLLTPVLINAGASEAFAHSSTTIAMTITKSEATRRGYWCTSKGGFLDLDEIALLQGFPAGLVPWQHLGISPAQYGSLLGNAMTLPVVVYILPALLLAGGKIAEMQADELYKRARAFQPVA